MPLTETVLGATVCPSLGLTNLTVGRVASLGVLMLLMVPYPTGYSSVLVERLLASYVVAQ
jgi:hypothetical protein